MHALVGVHTYTCTHALALTHSDTKTHTHTQTQARTRTYTLIHTIPTPGASQFRNELFFPQTNHAEQIKDKDFAKYLVSDVLIQKKEVFTT